MQKTIRICLALFGKQKTEMLRNKKVWILFLIFPITMIIMSLLDDSSPASLMLFVVMGCVMPPVIGIASQVAEEREKGIIRGLIYVGVNSFEYLGGMMLCTGLFSFICICLMCMFLENQPKINMDPQVMVVCLIAIVCSMIIGAIIGIAAKNQIAVSAMTVPVSLSVLFVSILGINKEAVHEISQYLYSQVIIDVFVRNQVKVTDYVILAVNLVIFFLGFVIVYKKRRNED